MSTSIVMDSPLGHLKITACGESITHCFFTQEPLSSGVSSLVLNRAAEQLNEYFDGKRAQFDLKLAPRGTDFEQAVWQALLNIPYGQTSSYQAVAKVVNNPEAVRAVGRANGKNPIAIIIPCHRVIRASGELGDMLVAWTIKPGCWI